MKKSVLDYRIEQALALQAEALRRNDEDKVAVCDRLLASYLKELEKEIAEDKQSKQAHTNRIVYIVSTVYLIGQLVPSLLNLL